MGSRGLLSIFARERYRSRARIQAPRTEGLSLTTRATAAQILH